MGIRIILILGLAFIGWLVLRHSASAQTQALRKIGTAVVLAGGVFFVMFPNTLSDVAHVLGVGRGTDLLLYAFIMLTAVTVVGLAQRIHRLERRLEQLTRAVALDRRDENASAHDR